jgi:hypothetical protein
MDRPPNSGAVESTGLTRLIAPRVAQIAPRTSSLRAMLRCRRRTPLFTRASWFATGPAPMSNRSPLTNPQCSFRPTSQISGLARRELCSIDGLSVHATIDGILERNVDASALRLRRRSSQLYEAAPLRGSFIAITRLGRRRQAREDKRTV